jgi:hypothetical protein
MSAGKTEAGMPATPTVASLQQDLQQSEERARRVQELRQEFGDDRQVQKPSRIYDPLPDKGRYLDIKV